MAKPAREARPIDVATDLPEALLDWHWREHAAWLERLRVNRRPPPALVITGPTGIGKAAFARRLGRALGCESGLGAMTPPSSTGPCEQCTACQRERAGQSIAMSWVLPEAEQERVSVDQLRELKASQGFGAFGGGYRVFVIPSAERLGPQAANALLKILEEPPPGWVLLLTASDPSLLLPTLLSRLQRLRLRPLPSALLSAALGTLDPAPSAALRDRAVRLAFGSYGQARSLLESAGAQMLADLSAYLTHPPDRLEPLLDQATRSTESLERLIGLLERWVAQPEVKLPRESSAHGAPWIERLARARALVQVPLNKRLVAQDLLLPWVTAPRTESC